MPSGRASGGWCRSLIGHIESTKKYGVLTHLRYIFNFNVSRIVVNMHADLKELPPLTCPAGYAVREMDADDPEEIAAWISLVNQAYPDADETPETFLKHRDRHAFLDAPKIFFVTKDARIVATFTAGLYRSNPEYGGDSRIAVLPTERGKGIGIFCINYAFHFLRNQGAGKGESVIMIRRTQSLLLHFRCGFRPEFDRRKVMFNPQRRMWPARWIARRRVERLHAQFCSEGNSLPVQIPASEG